MHQNTEHTKMTSEIITIIFVSFIYLVFIKSFCRKVVMMHNSR